MYHTGTPLWENPTLCFCYSENSLRHVLSTILDFRKFSGLTISWSTLALLLLDKGVIPVMASLCPVPVLTSFKYLGIVISAQLIDYLNIFPLLTKFRDKVKLWIKLWISVAGRANLVKMILMPQLLYHLHNSPVGIPLKIFRVVNTIFQSLLWKG